MTVRVGVGVTGAYFAWLYLFTWYGILHTCSLADVQQSRYGMQTISHYWGTYMYVDSGAAITSDFRVEL